MSDFEGFNADAVIDALTGPSIKWQDTVYEGRILSLPELLPLAEEFDEMAQQDETPIGMLQDLARRLFSKLEIQDEDGEPFPIDAFLDEVPGKVVVGAVEDFLAHQLEATGMDPGAVTQALETRKKVA